MEQTTNQNPMSMSPKKGGMSKIIMWVVILIVIIALAMMWMKKSEVKQLDQQIEQKKAEIMGADAQVKVLQQQGTSNDPASIEADLKDTNTDNLDAQ